MNHDKHLTNQQSADKIKKFSYVDSQGNKKDSHKDVRMPKKTETDLVSIGNYINIGYNLVVPLLLGVMIGLFLDAKLQTKPWFTLCLIIGGAGLSIYNLYSLVKKENERRRT